LRALAQEPEVVAIGETGLDFHRNLSPRQEQERAFREHLRLGVEMDLPVVVHCRDAYKEAVAIMGEEGARRGVMHCFSGNVENAREALHLGFYLSIAGPITYPKSDRLRDIVRFLPLDRLLVETDCPFLAPQAIRGKRNEPAFVYHVVRECAAIKGVSMDRMAEAVAQNSRELFGSLFLNGAERAGSRPLSD
jgi:TatD DNase family protein